MTSYGLPSGQCTIFIGVAARSLNQMRPRPRSTTARDRQGVRSEAFETASWILQAMHPPGATGESCGERLGLLRVHARAQSPGGRALIPLTVCSTVLILEELLVVRVRKGSGLDEVDVASPVHQAQVLGVAEGQRDRAAA